MDNLRLIIIIVIFCGIVIAFVYSRFVRIRGKTKQKHMQETQQHKASEEKKASSVVDNFLVLMNLIRKKKVKL
ncbi:MAG: hypothetical protein SCARUB_01567 [Candidatus Scalindua rubra]|uniref:Uncharacterized protein n=1 Tax=Candidatus Scalindua rubra TaxID=1872076 RepID=A0A1E3XCH6_9BACT|nr:MAG: hypothetical protein SCARUB_01567 [Candidatus Scalindua rubra]